MNFTNLNVVAVELILVMIDFRRFCNSIDDFAIFFM